LRSENQELNSTKFKEGYNPFKLSFILYYRYKHLETMDYYSNLVDIEPEIIDCMNYKELQKVAKDNGLKAGGKKEILRQSILDLKV